MVETAEETQDVTTEKQIWHHGPSQLKKEPLTDGRSIKSFAVSVALPLCLVSSYFAVVHDHSLSSRILEVKTLPVVLERGEERFFSKSKGAMQEVSS